MSAKMMRNLVSETAIRWIIPLTLCASGCATMGEWAYVPPRIEDPAPRVVGRVPLPPPEVRDPARPATPGSGLSDGAGELPAIDPETADSEFPFGSTADPPSLGPDLGPRITIEDVRKGAKLELDVRVPPTKQVGSAVTFQIIVRNSGDESAADVTVESEFDEALSFPGSDETHVRQSLGTLAAGDSREIALTLTSDSQGKHCCRFTVFAGGKEAIWKSVCVEFEARRVALSLQGPQQRTVGSRAEYVLKVANTSSAALHNLLISLHHDPALAPREASEGARQEPRRLHWEIPELAAGEGLQLQVEFECLQTAEDTCLRIDVVGDGVPSDFLERCLTVAPVRGVLDVRVSDRLDPIRNGDENEYEVTVRNLGLLAVDSVRVDVLLPSSLRATSARVLDGELPLPVNFQVDGQRLTFDPLPRLRPDGIVRLVVQTKALHAGEEALVVEVRSGETDEAIEAVEFTTVNP